MALWESSRGILHPREKNSVGRVTLAVSGLSAVVASFSRMPACAWHPTDRADPLRKTAHYTGRSDAEGLSRSFRGDHMKRLSRMNQKLTWMRVRTPAAVRPMR